MNYKELLESGANVSVTVGLDDLREIFKETVSGLKPESADPQPEEFLSRKEVLALLKIDSSTLWNWEKTGYIKSFPFGGRKRYKLEDVEAIRTGKKGGRHGK
ncbi:MAG: DNA-binding protein [Alistipes sp.]|nr:DNA-binding protein [Alistipes sp.]